MLTGSVCLVNQHSGINQFTDVDVQVARSIDPLQSIDKTPQVPGLLRDNEVADLAIETSTSPLWGKFKPGAKYEQFLSAPYFSLPPSSMELDQPDWPVSGAAKEMKVIVRRTPTLVDFKDSAERALGRSNLRTETAYEANVVRPGDLVEIGEEAKPFAVPPSSDLTTVSPSSPNEMGKFGGNTNGLPAREHLIDLTILNGEIVARAEEFAKRRNTIKLDNISKSPSENLSAGYKEFLDIVEKFAALRKSPNESSTEALKRLDDFEAKEEIVEGALIVNGLAAFTGSSDAPTNDSSADVVYPVTTQRQRYLVQNPVRFKSPPRSPRNGTGELSGNTSPLTVYPKHFLSVEKIISGLEEIEKRVALIELDDGYISLPEMPEGYKEFRRKFEKFAALRESLTDSSNT